MSAKPRLKLWLRHETAAKAETICKNSANSRLEPISGIEMA